MPQLIQCCIRFLAVCGLLLASAQGIDVGADEVYLHDGRILEGEILSEEGSDPIDIRIVSGRVSAVIHVAKRDILKIKRGVSDKQKRLEEVEARVEQASKLEPLAAADALWQAAVDLRDMGQVIRYREVAQRVIDANRHHAEARKALGFKLHRGVWMKPHEIATAEGKVLHKGRWKTWSEYQAILKAEEEELLRRQERLAKREEEREARARERRIRAAASADTSLQPIYTNYGSPYYPYRSDSLLYRYYAGYIGSCGCSSRYSSSRSYSHGASLNFSFGGSGWGVSGGWSGGRSSSAGYGY